MLQQASKRNQAALGHLLSVADCDDPTMLEAARQLISALAMSHAALQVLATILRFWGESQDCLNEPAYVQTVREFVAGWDVADRQATPELDLDGPIFR